MYNSSTISESFEPITTTQGYSNFGLSSYSILDEWLEDDIGVVSKSVVNHVNEVGPTSSQPSQQVEGLTNSKNEKKKKEKKVVKERVAFKTKSKIEVLDDGFRWRKYGKKKVKNTPYPRNYYRCAVEGCPVKKRVERDGEDPSYVITTYEANHNHHSPS